MLVSFGESAWRVVSEGRSLALWLIWWVEIDEIVLAANRWRSSIVCRAEFSVCISECPTNGSNVFSIQYPRFLVSAEWNVEFSTRIYSVQSVVACLVEEDESCSRFNRV